MQGYNFGVHGMKRYKLEKYKLTKHIRISQFALEVYTSHYDLSRSHNWALVIDLCGVSVFEGCTIFMRVEGCAGLNVFLSCQIDALH